MSTFVISGLSATIGALAFYMFTARRTAATAAPATAAPAAAAANSSDDAAASSSNGAPLQKAQRSRNSALRKEWNKKKLKMILCVRNDCGMQKGKMIAQGCHAAVGVVTELLQTQPELVESWDYNGAMKIAVKVNSEAELDELERKADELGLPNYKVHDAGHTQVAPDTKTVLAIGPAPAEVLDKLTGHLKLM